MCKPVLFAVEFSPSQGCFHIEWFTGLYHADNLRRLLLDRAGGPPSDWVVLAVCGTHEQATACVRELRAKLTARGFYLQCPAAAEAA